MSATGIRSRGWARLPRVGGVTGASGPAGGPRTRRRGPVGAAAPRYLAAVLLLIAGLATHADAAGACALDQKPSVYADGRLARFNPQVPTTAAQLAEFSLFYFDRSFPARQIIIFTEDRRDVANSLTPAAMIRPWRWQFGDGNTAWGWTVHHGYTRPGRWRILVDAYDPGTRRWYNFDQVTITIRSR